MNISAEKSVLISRLSSLSYWWTRLVPDFHFTPIRIALIYSIFALLALYVSDILLVLYISDPLLTQVQTLKGGVEVLLTTVLILGLTHRRDTQLSRSVDHLDRQRQELDVLHRVLRHNLRNYLNVIQSRADLIYRKDPSEPIENDCQEILDTVDKMVHFTEQAGLIRRLTSKNGTVNTINLSDQITNLTDDIEVSYGEVEFTVEVPEGVIVEGSPLIDEALRELILNAVQHNESEESTVRMEVDPRSDFSHLVEIEISDNGPGIPESELRPLQMGSEQQLQHSTGLGLWFVKWTIRHSDGELDFEADGDKGTSVTVRLPKSPTMLSATFANH